MDIVKSKESGSGKKKNMLMKTWERCRSMTISRQKYQPNEEEAFTFSPRVDTVTITTSKSLPHFFSSKSEQKVAPQGCFSVYVGPEKQRFVIKAKHANHPLFQMLLEDSEMEYGYSSQGPILLPCEVDLLYKVLAEIDNQLPHHDHRNLIEHVDGYALDYTASCSPFMNSSRHRIRDQHHGDNNIGSYGLLSSPMLKLNR